MTTKVKRLAVVGLVALAVALGSLTAGADDAAAGFAAGMDSGSDGEGY